MRFVVKGHRGRGVAIVPESFATVEAAKERAFELLNNEGSGIRVEIWLEGSSRRPLHDSRSMAEEYLKQDHALI